MLIGTCPTFWAERIGFLEFWILAILGPRVLRALSTFFLNPSYFVGPGYAADGSAAGRTLNPNQAPLPSRPGTKYVAQGTLAATKTQMYRGPCWVTCFSPDVGQQLVVTN